MRIRSIKPEFWRSDDIAALPISARLTFIGLWSYVDDNGVGSAKLSSIVADLYAEDMATDPPETLRRVSGDLQTLADRGLIVFYEAAGKQLLFITNWKTHQVVNKPSLGHKYPLPTAEMLELTAGQTPAEPPSPEVSGGSPETLRPGAGEQGSRGAGERGSSVAGASPRATAAKPQTTSSAWKLVNKTCRDLSKATKTALVEQASLLLADDKDEATITAALEKWMNRAEARPGLLPFLADDVIKERSKTASDSTELTGNDREVTEIVKRGKRLADEARKALAAEQQALAAHSFDSLEAA